MTLERLFVSGYKWIYLGILLAMIGIALIALWRDFKLWKERYQKLPPALRSELRNWAGPRIKAWLRERLSENKALAGVILSLFLVLVALSLLLLLGPVP